jgi:hypothetical protein
MADLSILEFGVYGLITYSSLLMLIISTIKEVPTERSGSVLRGIWLVPGIICAFILSSSGIIIVTSDVTNTIVAVNTTEVWTETISSSISLQNPIWVTVHMLIFFVLIVYVIIQVLTLFTKIK